jgi:PAS domain S-box-containing protein
MQGTIQAIAANHDLRSDGTPYRLLVESVPDYAIFMLDPEGCIRSWNRGAQRIKGYAADEVIGRHFSLFYPPEKIAERWPEHELAMARTHGRFEDEGWRVRKDGSRFWANVVISRIDDADGTLRGFAKVTRDLSDRREQEERLRHSEERFRVLVEGVRDYAIFMLDTQGHVASWNAGAEQIKGYRADEIVGQHFSVFYPPDAIAQDGPARLLQVALDEGRTEDEGWRVRKDGSRFWASVVITALYDNDGRHAGFAKVTRDLTAHRRIRALEDEGQRLTTFLAMLGHELRNPLAPIANAVSIMRLELIESPTLRHCRDVIGRQLQQITRLVDDLLDVSRFTRGKIRLQQQTLDLRSVLADSVEAVEAEAARRSQSLRVETPEAPAWVVGDRARLVQVVSNLLTNAVKFTQHHGHIAATLRLAESHAELEVRDDGPGIPPDQLAEVFEPFVQGEQDAARTQGGLGLGLSLVQQLVALHNGEVSAASSGQPGEGAAFRIRLPLAREPTGAIVTERVPALLVPRQLLVVDDNRDAADSLQALLRRLGYHCQVAYDGVGALELVRSGRFDAVFIDLGLPDLHGVEVVRLLRAELAVPPRFIAVTGYGQDHDLEATRTASFHAHLTKPLAAEQIADLLAGLFN